MINELKMAIHEMDENGDDAIWVSLTRKQLLWIIRATENRGVIRSGKFYYADPMLGITDLDSAGLYSKREAEELMFNGESFISIDDLCS